MKRGIQLASPNHDNDGDQESYGKFLGNDLCIQLISIRNEEIIKYKFIFSFKNEYFLCFKLIIVDASKNITPIAGADRSKKMPILK